MPCAQTTNNLLHSHAQKEGGPWQEGGLAQGTWLCPQENGAPSPDVEFGYVGCHIGKDGMTVLYFCSYFALE